MDRRTALTWSVDCQVRLIKVAVVHTQQSVRSEDFFVGFRGLLVSLLVVSQDYISGYIAPIDSGIFLSSEEES